MDTAAIREQLHQYLEMVDEKNKSHLCNVRR